MKAKQKAKIKPVKKASRNSASRTVFLTHSKHRIVRSFRLVEHKHTGKLLHHRHTSHLALFILLLLVGILLFMSVVVARVQAENGTVSVGVIVAGPAPVIGATVVSPVSGTSYTDQYTTQVTGTCAPGLFVVVQNNGELVGSTVCTTAGIFVMQVQLQRGENVLSALNYDNLDQPGPNTPLVNITVVTTSSAAMQPLQPIRTLVPVLLPANPSIVAGVTPGVSSCDEQTIEALPTGGVPRVAIVCVPRFVQANTEYSIGITVWGGEPPYAAELHKGDDSEGVLLSIVKPGLKTVRFSYASAGVFTVRVKLTDKDGKTAIVQTAVQSIGEKLTPVAVLTKEVFSTSWFKTPVPMYILAVAITLGFWGGDLFDRMFGARKPRHSSRRAI